MADPGRVKLAVPASVRRGTVARLRAVEGKWKDRPDPLAELESIRNDDGGEH